MSTTREPQPTDRLAKLFGDLHSEDDLDSGNERLRRVHLQLIIPPAAAHSETGQVTALIAAATGARAFPAGVRIVLPDDAALLTAAGNGAGSLAAALTDVGGSVTTFTAADLPTVIVGDAAIEVPGITIAVRAIARGWAGGAVPTARPCPSVVPGVLGATTAGAIAVSEVFQAFHGIDARAAYRSAGFSLWDPSVPWDTPAAVGPALQLLPSEIWLLGLGHLGQAAAWLLRALPYADPGAVNVTLQDGDTIATENWGTSLLTRADDIDEPKPTVVKAALKHAGFKIRLVERRLDQHQRIQPGEPRVLLSGLDSASSRRPLSGVGFDLMIDAGIGGAAADFTSIRVIRLTDDRTSQIEFADDPEVDEPAEDDDCGLIVAAGQAVATSFVGAATAAVSFGEILRPLHLGASMRTISVDLRDPCGIQRAVREPHSLETPPHTLARPLRETPLA
jgi:hypothetical protein